MRWFKHMSGSNRDEVLVQLRNEFGVHGYGAYFLILEIIADQMDEKSISKVTYPIKFWQNFVGFSPKKFKNFTKFMQNHGLFFLKFSENYLTIDCPKMLSYRDEHTLRLASKNREKLPSNSRVTPEQDIDIDLDLDLPPISPKKTQKIPLLIKNDAFEDFWRVYPNKKSKATAKKAWNKLKPDEQLQNTLLEALEQAKKSDQWTKDGGKFIPHPATWLNGQRWLDEYTTTKPPSGLNLKVVPHTERQGGLLSWD